MKRILIVEDDIHIQDIFRIIFNSHGYTVECVESGEKLYKTDLHWPDLIILDKQLPGISGLEACKRLKANADTKIIPVIMISALSGVREAALLAGADDYIEKPFTMHTLLDKVAGFTDGNKNPQAVL
jgi:DNA-binding response OmpR family regulator